MATQMSRIVLIVEDSPQMATNLEIALTGMPEVDVRVTDSAAGALRMLDQNLSGDVAAVITDLEMPSMTGFELIERLRSHPKFSRVPIIVSSGSVDPGAPARARWLGADAYFTKPYSPSALRRKLEELIDGSTEVTRDG